MLDMFIGKVIEVSNTNICVAINKELETPYIIVDSNPIRIAGVGSFLKIENDIYEIINEKTILEYNKKEQSIKIAINRVAVCKVIGYFEGEIFKQGNSGETPNILNTIFTELFDNINTNGSYFLFVDTNGEYSKAFTAKKINRVLDTRDSGKNTIQIPLDLLENEDWRLLLEATEKTQYPIIKTVWNGVTKNIFAKGAQADIAKYLLNELKQSIIIILNSNANTTNKLGAIQSIKEDFAFMEDEFYRKIEIIFDIFKDYIVNSNRLVVIDGSNFADCMKYVCSKIRKFHMQLDKNSFTIEDMGFLLNITHLYRTYKYSMNENNTSPLIGRFITNKNDFKVIFPPYVVGKKRILSTVYLKKKMFWFAMLVEQKKILGE